jgi:hypothetical protein
LQAAAQASAPGAPASPATSPGATAQIGQAANTNASAPDSGYRAAVSAAVQGAVTALTGDVLATLEQAIADSGGTAAAALAQSLKGALGSGSVISRIEGFFADRGQGTVVKRLSSWLAAHEGELTGAALGVRRAKGVLAAASTLESALAAAAKAKPAAARTTIAAALQQAAAMQSAATAVVAPVAPLLPNPPWLPMAAAVTVSYSASDVVTGPAPGRMSRAPMALLATGRGQAAAPPPQPAPQPDGFLHLDLFDQVTNPSPAEGQQAGGGEAQPRGMVTLAASRGSPARPAPGAPLLPKVEGQAALYVDLTVAADQISLLFVLTAGPDGWSDAKTTIEWQKNVGAVWVPIQVLADTTDGLKNTGIVTLQIAAGPDEDDGAAGPGMIAQVISRLQQAGWQAAASAGTGRSAGAQALATMRAPSLSLRAVVLSGVDRTPLVTHVVANAVAASWVGPGGASSLGTPLPAGTITQSVSPIAGVGTVAQPMPSVGGYPPATGAAFEMWMAERLRHKGFAIDPWDYARLALAQVPSLWQVAVVPAVDHATGAAQGGAVWVVAVAGPQTPNVADRTEPMADPGVLSEIGQVLRAVASPFATLAVTNPPYVRLTVQADLTFGDDETVLFWTDRLNTELVAWLSPWPPDTSLGVRPANYYTRPAIADFLRARPYVRAVRKLTLAYEALPASGWCYITSAAKHRLNGHTPKDTAPPVLAS